MIISLFTRTFLTTDQDFINKAYPDARILTIDDLRKNNITIDPLTPLADFDSLMKYLMKDNIYSYNFIVCGQKSLKKILCCYFKLLKITVNEVSDYLEAYLYHSKLWKYLFTSVAKLKVDTKEKESRDFFIKSFSDMYRDNKYQNEVTDKLLSIPKDHPLLKEIPVEWMFNHVQKSAPGTYIHEIAKKKVQAFSIYSILSIKNQILAILFMNNIPIDKKMILTKEQMKGYVDEKDYYVDHHDEYINLIHMLRDYINTSIADIIDRNDNEIDVTIYSRLIKSLCFLSLHPDNLFEDPNELLNETLDILDFGYSGINVFKINKALLRVNLKNEYFILLQGEEDE